MGIAISLQQYLDGRGVPFDVTTHERTLSSSETARASSISEDSLAKGVLMRREDGYLLAIVPASCRVEVKALADWLKEPIVLASETEASTIFGDCELGCVPPVAGAYDLMAVVDDSLEGSNDIYFEGGDHRTLVHLTGHNFHRLMSDVPHVHIGEHRRVMSPG
jgi:Ala-tRNA(Pro) deacylase